MSKIIEENLDENLSIDLNYQAISNILNIDLDSINSNLITLSTL